MTPATTFAGRTVALFGLGGSGLATALSLQAGGARVLACDDDPERMAKAAGQGIETADLRTADWSGIAALVLSPGVPLTHPEPHWSAKLATAAGVEIIGDIELFCRERAKIAPDAPFVAITGTNGKSTTTALIAHILREAGKDVQMGGNIGTAILSLEPPARKRFHVVEMSSFQIDLTPSLQPTIGVLLNISPDHLDRHGTMEKYVSIKETLIARAKAQVCGIDDPFSALIAERNWNSRTRFISTEKVLSFGFYALNSTVVKSDFGRHTTIADLSLVSTLRGKHNAQNACAAAAVAVRAGVDPKRIEASLHSFPGLPHRMEEVGRRGPTLFINDSKATNADSAAKALSSFPRVFWILGGQPKEGGITVLQPYFDRVERAYLIGAASDSFAETLEGQVPFERCETLDRAVRQAAADAEAAGGESVVLLSPACASYDQYSNFEKRGDHFRDLVRALPGVEPKA